jgi:hypothetical protein
MPDEYTKRGEAAIAIVLLMSAFAVCTLGAFYARVEAGQTREMVMDDARFAGVRAILPARGTIGYVTDIDTEISPVTGRDAHSDTGGGTARNRRAYYLTQYFLAPVVVAPDTAHELVIANFVSASAIAAFAAARGLRVERDFSNGVALLRRRR